MPEFYFQIKGLQYNDEERSYGGKWSWPPLFSGKVEADDSKKARALVNEMFEQQFPCRVKSDDNSAPFLLHMTEISEKESHIKELFAEKECQACGRVFRRIDLYNDHHETYKGTEFCCQGCKDAAKAAEMVAGKDDPYGMKTVPCIYRITNRKTGMCYIGQTKQAFTLRWWQHVKWGATDCKFHQALRDSELTDWTFEVVEVCKADELDEREVFHIEAHGSIDSGYNTAPGNRKQTEQRNAGE